MGPEEASYSSAKETNTSRCTGRIQPAVAMARSRLLAPAGGVKPGAQVDTAALIKNLTEVPLSPPTAVAGHQSTPVPRTLPVRYLWWGGGAWSNCAKCGQGEKQVGGAQLLTCEARLSGYRQGDHVLLHVASMRFTSPHCPRAPLKRPGKSAAGPRV
ncbi:hypothetical protein AAFF_G00335850 [Aldrovandia affinis]|uniref:Uncharacterized protein n=1 Tax=Aldrovandia affinis TaxID=143900 RepID=A0AAD7SMG4_9TELE|nr:hypothetical protein AAFF_G00335850 [Aldrovandia affinis]